MLFKLFFLALLAITIGEKYLKTLCDLSEELKVPYLECLQQEMSHITLQYIDEAQNCLQEYYGLHSKIDSLEKLGGCKGNFNFNIFIDCLDKTDKLHAYLQESRTEKINREIIATYCVSLIKNKT